jgi:gentisate 1,2-dioxygenase
VSSTRLRAKGSEWIAYPWEHTDRALAEQLRLEEECFPGVLEKGRAAVRFVNPTTGGDIMSTIRAEFHRLRVGAVSAERREVGSRAFQLFEGKGEGVLDGVSRNLEKGEGRG